MSIWGKFFSKKTVNDLSSGELDQERIRLEEEERRVLSRMEKIEDEKKRMFERGAAESSKSQKIVIARKIKEMEEQRKELDMRASTISKQLRIVSKLGSVQRNKKKLQENGVWKLVSKMSPDQLEGLLTGAIVADTAENEKLRQLIEIIESDPRATSREPEDADIMRLVEIMEQAGESGDTDEKYREADGVLHSGPEKESERV